MKTKQIVTAVAFALLGTSAAFAQTTGSTDTKSYDQGQSARCNTMSGAEKDQCVRDEATKTEGKKDESSNSTSGPSATSGSTSSDDAAKSEVKKDATDSSAGSSTPAPVTEEKK